MTRYDLVYRVNGAIGKTLARSDITFATPPIVGDAVQWHPDWGLATVQYRYVGDDWIELGLGVLNQSEVADHLAAGWVERG